ncbi:MAG: hypothetical protein ABIL58_24090 [Pseudomonadota bacterium]
MVNTPMAPILFPHTRVGQKSLSDLLAVFEQVHLKCASDDDLPSHLISARDARRLAISWPTTDDGVNLRQLVSDYRQWIEDCRGTEMRVRHLQRGIPPLVDASSVARLREQILSIKDGGGAESIDDSRHMAQLFLLAAETLATETADLQAAMAGHTENERALFEQLHGDPSELALFPRMPSPVQDIDPCAHMTSQWISAWCRLVLDDTHVPGVWVTFSDAVVSWMREVFGEIREIGVIPRGALSSDGFAGKLDDLLREAGTRTGDSLDGIGNLPVGDTVGPSPAMVLLQIPGVSPRAAAERLLHGSGAPAPGGAGDAKRHLVIVRWYEK